MTEKSPKPHNFWLVQFLHHAKGSKKRSSSTRLALAAQIFFQFFQRHFLQFTRRRKDGNKNEKRMRSWMAPWTLAAAPTAQPPTCKSGTNPVVRAHKMPWHAGNMQNATGALAPQCPGVPQNCSQWHAGNIQNATGAPAPQCARVPHNCANTHPGSHAWRFPHAGAAHCTSTE